MTMDKRLRDMSDEDLQQLTERFAADVLGMRMTDKLKQDISKIITQVEHETQAPPSPPRMTSGLPVKPSVLRIDGAEGRPKPLVEVASGISVSQHNIAEATRHPVAGTCPDPKRAQDVEALREDISTSHQIVAALTSPRPKQVELLLRAQSYLQEALELPEEPTVASMPVELQAVILAYQNVCKGWTFAAFEALKDAVAKLYASVEQACANPPRSAADVERAYGMELRAVLRPASDDDMLRAVEQGIAEQRGS